MNIREFILSWILPRNEKTLHDWLIIIELFNVLLSFFVLLFLVLTLLAQELLQALKFGILLLMFIMGLSTLNLMQYLLTIEFSTRKGYILKRRK